MRAVVRGRDGQTGPSRGELPADLSLRTLADALGVFGVSSQDIASAPWNQSSAPLSCGIRQHAQIVEIQAGSRCEAQCGRRKAREAAAAAPYPADRSLLLADAEWLEDLDHARGVRLALCRASGRHFQGRSVLAALSGDLAEQQDTGDRRSGR